jgi:5-methylcytosine-specific restriction endonuclease McrA
VRLGEPVKGCLRCGETLPLTAFHKLSRNKDGLHTWCKECVCAIRRAAYAANPGPSKARRKRWAEQNPEKLRVLWAKRKDANREYARTRRAQDPEYRERARLRTKAWWAKMTDEERREYVRTKNAKKSPEQRRKEARLYAQRHPEKIAIFAAKKDAKRKGAPVVEHVDRTVVWDRDGGICGICGELADKATWQLDHIVPLARGGEHSYANTQVSHAFCNASKGAKVA